MDGEPESGVNLSASSNAGTSSAYPSRLPVTDNLGVTLPFFFRGERTREGGRLLALDAVLPRPFLERPAPELLLVVVPAKAGVAGTMKAGRK